MKKGINVSKGTTLVSSLVLLGVILMYSQGAKADWTGTGTTGSDCIYFGRIWGQLTSYPYTSFSGWGTCVWEYGHCGDEDYFDKGEYTSSSSEGVYKVCGDSCVYNEGSRDLIQLSYYDDLHFCGTYNGRNWWISNSSLPSSGTPVFLIWGDGGNDDIRLCSDSTCNDYWTNASNYADGRYGDDDIDGTPIDDHLWGMNGVDQISGNAGNDVIYGGEDGDYLYGGDGLDIAYGDNGNDYCSSFTTCTSCQYGDCP